ncbi:MAG: hypothetical protein J6Y18_00900, partial [Candidatus Methanomethylophilaceae archaeon]|nr:hypothetical protein [Candidatus Methanomethylophilaceae archaeon]
DGVKVVSEKLGIPEKDMLMDWGGEYELLFTFDRKDLDRITDTEVQFHIIGIITEDECLLHRDEKYEVIGDGRD